MFIIKKVQMVEGEPEFVQDYHKETSNIQDICDEYEKINLASQHLHVMSFGVSKDFVLIFCRNSEKKACVEVFYCHNFTAYCGEKNISEISNLYDFLKVLYTEQKIGGIDVMKILLDTSKTY